MPASRARCASSGPASASASTLTITMCLPCCAAREHVADAGGGIAGGVDDDLDLRRRDQRQRVVGDEGRAGLRRGGERARGEALGAASRCARATACARSGARSAMPTTWMPGVCLACARYIEPNLPAPISADVQRAPFGGALRAAGGGGSCRGRDGRGWRARGAGERGRRAQLASTARTPATPATCRATMPSFAAAATLIALSSTNRRPLRRQRRARRARAAKYSASGFSRPTAYDGKLWWKRSVSDHSRREALPVQLVGVGQRRQPVARRERRQQLLGAGEERARPPRERGEEVVGARPAGRTPR